MGCRPYASTQNFPLFSPRHISLPLRRPIRGTRRHFHDNSTIRCLLSECWGHSLGTWDVGPFTHTNTHTHTRPSGERGKTKCPPWLAADWSCLTGASVRVSVLTWDWLYQNAKERSFIFNSSRGLPGSAGWLWDDLIPALWWAEVMLRSSDFW